MATTTKQSAQVTETKEQPKMATAVATAVSPDKVKTATGKPVDPAAELFTLQQQAEEARLAAESAQNKFASITAMLQSPQYKELVSKELDVSVTGLLKKAKTLGLDSNDVISVIVAHPLAVPVKKRRGAKGTANPKAPRLDVDTTGARPEIGATYLLNGEKWTKQKLGATKKTFLEAIKAGSTWAQLKTQ